MAQIQRTRVENDMNFRRSRSFDNLNVVQDLGGGLRGKEYRAKQKDAAQQNHPRSKAQLVRIISDQRKPLG